MENKKIRLEYIGKYNNRTVITTIDYVPGMVINGRKLLSITLPTNEIIYKGKVVSPKTYKKNHPDNKIRMGKDDLVIDSEFSYPINAKENTYTLDELTVGEHSTIEYKQRVGKTLDTETISMGLYAEPESEYSTLILEPGVLDMPCIGARSIYERKIKLYDYEFTINESEPWTVYGTEKTQKEIEEKKKVDERYDAILAKMKEKEAASVIELANGGFVIADENHIPSKKLVK